MKTINKRLSWIMALLLSAVLCVSLAVAIYDDDTGIYYYFDIVVDRMDPPRVCSDETGISWSMTIQTCDSEEVCDADCDDGCNNLIRYLNCPECAEDADCLGYPGGQFPDGETEHPCLQYYSTGEDECEAACSDENCIFKRKDGWPYCESPIACSSHNCISSSSQASIYACDNNEGIPCGNRNYCFFDAANICAPPNACLFDHDYDESMIDCEGECFADPGSTDKDVDNDGDNDYCDSGVWFDCLDADQCQGSDICVMGECMPEQNSYFQIKNSDDEVIAWIGEEGYMFVNGRVNVNEDSISSGTNNFLVKDSGGNVVAKITSNGNLYLLSYVYEKEDEVTPDGNDFVIKNAEGTNVAMVTNDGKIYLKGTLVYPYFSSQPDLGEAVAIAPNIGTFPYLPRNDGEAGCGEI